MSREIVQVGESGGSPMLSPAIKYGNLVFTSGMVGRDPSTGELAEGIENQSRNTLENLKAALEAAGTSMDQVLKASCFVANIDDRPAFNEVYKGYFPNDPPVRTCVQAARLGEGVLIEVDVIAGVPD